MSADNDRLNLLLDLRRYADAEKAVRDAIGRDPQWAAAYTHLARALMASVLSQKSLTYPGTLAGFRRVTTASKKTEAVWHARSPSWCCPTTNARS